MNEGENEHKQMERPSLDFFPLENRVIFYFIGTLMVLLCISYAISRFITEITEHLLEIPNFGL